MPRPEGPRTAPERYFFIFFLKAFAADQLAFAYVRASTQEEVRQGSNERQKDVITQYASLEATNLDSS